VSKADQESAEFEAKKQAFEGELTGRGLESKGASFILDIDGKNLYAQLVHEEGAYQIGTRFYANAATDKPEQKVFKSATLYGLDAQITKALAWIDKKLGEMKKVEEDQAKAIAEREAEQNARNAEVQEEIRITGVGKTVVPGVRPADARETGVMYELLQKGEITQDQWNAYVEDLYVSNKAPRPEPETTNPDAAGDATDEVSTSVATLDDILNGKYQTSDEIMPLLEQVAEAFERLALAEDSPEMKKLDQAADYMTAILDKEAV
jgi:polyhydroxyalkanoate synthesis regulator phasin